MQRALKAQTLGASLGERAQGPDALSNFSLGAWSGITWICPRFHLSLRRCEPVGVDAQVHGFLGMRTGAL